MYAPLQIIKPRARLRAIILFCALSALMFLLSASGVYAQATATTSGSLSRDGVFSCRAAAQANIGSTVAIQGVYVPVSDAAVTLNTGYLVYKECVLDGVVSMIKNDVVAGLQAQAIRAVETSRNGNAQYLKNFEKDLRPYFDAILIEGVNAAKSGTLCPAFRDRVPTATTLNYYNAVKKVGTESICPFGQSDAERQAMVNGSAVVNWSTWNNLIEPRGYEIGAYYLQKNQIEMQLATYDYNIREQLGWGNGFFPVFDNAQNPLAQNVITPGYLIAEGLQRMISAGTDILVNANEIDQINGALQAGLQSTIVSDSIRGLSGLSMPLNGQPSYLQQMSSQASASVRNSAVNAALSILSAARQVETQYKTAKEAIANALTNAINKLRAAENTCWGLIIPKVQEKAASEGASLTIATTTEFSQKVISAEIEPLAATTINDLRVSEASLALINQLITSVTNTSSAAAQQAALVRLDSMVANNQLHSAQDAQNAASQRDSVLSALTILVDDTLVAWGDSTDPAIGWCNVNNQAVVDMWFNKWKQ